MIAPAIGVLLVAYSEALGVAYGGFGEKHGYEVDLDQELTRHVVANLASSLFGTIAVGSMSALAVKRAPARGSQVANLVTWGMAVVTVLFLTPLFRKLPEAVLAALIIHAVWHIIASRKLQRIRLISWTEFWLGVITFAGVVLIDVPAGHAPRFALLPSCSWCIEPAGRTCLLWAVCPAWRAPTRTCRAIRKTNRCPAC